MGWCAFSLLESTDVSCSSFDFSPHGDNNAQRKEKKVREPLSRWDGYNTWLLAVSRRTRGGGVEGLPRLPATSLRGAVNTNTQAKLLLRAKLRASHAPTRPAPAKSKREGPQPQRTCPVSLQTAQHNMVHNNTNNKQIPSLFVKTKIIAETKRQNERKRRKNYVEENKIKTETVQQGC